MRAPTGESIRAILFDIGGVLLRLQPEDSFVAFEDAGVPGFSHVWQHDTASKSLHRYEIGAIDTAQFRHEIFAALQASCSNEAFDRAFCAMIGPIAPPVWQLLDTLRDTLPLYVLSNNNVLHTSAIEREYKQFRSYFRGAYFSQEIGARKPDADCFDIAIEQGALNPAETLFIDDSPANIAAAQAAHLRALHLPRNGDLIAALRTCLPSTLGV